MRQCQGAPDRARHAATGVRTDARIWDANLAAERRWPGGRTDLCAADHPYFLEVVKTERTPHRRRILSPARLPYSWYWKHVAVILKGFDCRAVTILLRRTCIEAALGWCCQSCSHFVPKMPPHSARRGIRVRYRWSRAAAVRQASWDDLTSMNSPMRSQYPARSGEMRALRWR
jgi:hypothetical protein